MNEVLQKLFLVVVIIPFFFSWHSSSYASSSTTETIERIQGYGYSILLPQEPGWSVKTTYKNLMIAGKSGDDKDENYAIIILVLENVRVPIEGLDDKKILMDFSKSKVLREFPSDRFKLLTHTNEIHEPTDEICVRSYARVLDLKAEKKYTNPSPMTMDVFELICVHPYDPRTLVTVGYSHRYYLQEKDDIAFLKDKFIKFTKNIIWGKPIAFTNSNKISVDVKKQQFINAAGTGDYKTVENFLTEGLSVDIRASDGSTALIYAAYNGHFNIVKILIANGADVNRKSYLTDKNYSGRTALILAAQEGHVDILKILLENNADVNAKNQNGDTPLMYAAIRGNYEVVKILLANGADVNAKNNKGRTALMDAKKNSHLDIIELLKEAGAKEEVPTGPLDISVIE